jgi:hypothetical protein
LYRIPERSKKIGYPRILAAIAICFGAVRHYRGWQLIALVLFVHVLVLSETVLKSEIDRFKISSSAFISGHQRSKK